MSKEAEKNIAGGEEKNIENTVREILADRLEIEPGEITPESSFIEDFGIDSFWALELIFEMEDRFGITVPENDSLRIRTVKDLVDYITLKLESRK